MKIKLLFLAVFILLGGSLMSQNFDDPNAETRKKLLEATRKFLNEDNCDKAEEKYEIYKKFGGEKLTDIEEEIRKCKTPPSPNTKQSDKTKPSGQSGNNSFVPSGQTHGILTGHEWVDLGLPSGTLWATCNVGASRPEDNGNYYSWAEIKQKSSYGKDNYKHISDLSVLSKSTDAATANWGSGWRMPTKEQWEELKNNCKWIMISGGYKVVGSNGKFILLPAAGYRYNSAVYEVDTAGNYWSSSIYFGDNSRAWVLGFNFDGSSVYGECGYYGLSVRPVCVFRGSSRPPKPKTEKQD